MTNDQRVSEVHYDMDVRCQHGEKYTLHGHVGIGCDPGECHEQIDRFFQHVANECALAHGSATEQCHE